MHTNTAGKHANECETQLVLKHLRVQQRCKQEDQVNQQKGDDIVHYLKPVDKRFIKGLEQNNVAS